MLKKGRIMIILVLFELIIYSCGNDESKILKGEQKTCKEIVGDSIYFYHYKIVSDTLENWLKSKVIFDETIKSSKPTLFIDSTFCLNKDKTKFIGVLHFQSNLKTKSNDGLEELFGSKIDNQWYFWTGGFTPVVRNVSGHNPKKPLSYKQLHSMVSYGGYLDQKGAIRDEWFEAKFKGAGMGSFKDRYEYKYILDGNKIDNEKDYWYYIWKKKGLGLWINRACKDSIAHKEQVYKRPLVDEEKREISLAVSRKIVNTKFSLKK